MGLSLEIVEASIWIKTITRTLSYNNVSNSRLEVLINDSRRIFKKYTLL